MFKNPTSKKNVFFVISGVLVIISLISFFVRGFNYDIDFSGGTSFQIALGKEYTSDMEDTVNSIISEISGNTAQIQKTGDGTEMLIKTSELTNEQQTEVVEKLKESFGIDQSGILNVEKVGETVSKRLIGDSFKAVLIAIILMLIYITFRFDFQSGTSAVIALAQDVILMLGAYSLFQLPISTSFIAAVLTIVGYSINATIVVFDRVRENTKMMRKSSYNEIASKSIYQSYTRAINSSLTTLFTIGALYILGVTSIRQFALPIIIGIFCGTYSSLFIAPNFWAFWKESGVKGKRTGR
ncbi:MAG: protein translocase subunit SecF [Clostridia bacterium]|nr:protein translocase subunit SecF [Clostridia bacterium]